MLKNYSQLIAGIVIGLVAGLLIAKKVFITPGNGGNNIVNPVPDNRQKDKPVQPVTNPNKEAGIPSKVYVVLKYIRENKHAMDGYVGGRVFTNRERIVPEKDDAGNNIQYQEWDVNPKVQGQNRGTERILTGSDGRAWYTNDHYQTFTQIK
jgi:ribonuclease T1